jgi:hypothetical protein
MRPSPYLTRREFVGLSGLIASGPVVAIDGVARRSSGGEPAGKRSDAAGPDEVLRKLLEGNKRFRRGKTTAPRRKPEDFAKLAEGQTPRAMIVGCADSRVPPPRPAVSGTAASGRSAASRVAAAPTITARPRSPGSAGRRTRPTTSVCRRATAPLGPVAAGARTG